MSDWRDKSRIPKGMSDFQRWYRPEGIDKRKAPSDVDGILHTLNGNRFLMMEFKPANGALTVGQRITLQSFSKLPNCTSLAIFDPYSYTDDRKRYDDDEMLSVIRYQGGKQKNLEWSVAEFNTQIAEWFAGTGLLV